MDNSRPATIVDPDEFKGGARSGVYSPRSQTSQLRDLAKSPVSYTNGVIHKVEEVDDDDDADSMEQQQSEAGTALPVVWVSTWSQPNRVTHSRTARTRPA